MRTLSSVATLLAALAVAPVVGAQQPDTTAAADTVFGIEPLVVTVSRLPVRADRAGFAFTVIDAAELRAREPFYLSDALREQSGVFMDESVGPGGPTVVRIRGGEEVFTQILVDGVQINQNGGFFDLLGLQLSNLDRVEVARGPQSAVYGSSAVSGVIHFITPRGQAGSPEITGRLEGGGATDHGGNWRTEASVRGGSDRLRYSAGAGGAFSRGVWALPNDTRSRNGALRLDWAPTSAWQATVSGRLLKTESNLPVRDAGSTRVPLDPNARDKFDRRILSANLRFAPSASWTQSLHVSQFSEDFVFEDEFDGVTSPPEFFVFDANLRFLAELRRTTIRYQGSARVGAPGLAVVWGAQWEAEDLVNRITGDFADDLSLDRSTKALFGEVTWSPSADLTLLAGGRAEKYEGLTWDVTPRASAALTLANGDVTLRSSVGRAYKAPNLQQQFVDNPFIVANPDIRPETSVSAEVGADVVLAQDRVRTSVTLFRQTFDDLIRTVGIEGDTRQTNRNLGSARATGLEWSLRVQPGGPLVFGSEGAWIATEVEENVGLPPSEYPPGEALPFRPELVASAYVEYAAGDLAGRIGASRVGSQFVLTERFSGQRVEIDPYTVLGANASFQATPVLRLYARFYNLLDNAFFTAFDRPGAPASVALGVAVAF